MDDMVKFWDDDYEKEIVEFVKAKEWLLKENQEEGLKNFPEINITSGAYPEKTKREIAGFLHSLKFDIGGALRDTITLALLCVLEDVSWTSKAGACLKWDCRSDRLRKKVGGTFEKDHILDFGEAITKKTNEMLEDMDVFSSLFGETIEPKERLWDSTMRQGSCLDLLPEVPDEWHDCIFTSPPYLNRYDYTRTYALELAMLGIKNDEVSKLRQAMLSSTVENRAKDLLVINPLWAKPLSIVADQPLLTCILEELERKTKAGEMNNSGIVRMVRGYFQELACIVWECYRVLRPGGRMFMVNDNVRYAGLTIPVDTILTEIAERFGFDGESVMVRPQKKGNSSQQMGEHGNDPLRKCIYCWVKR